MNSKVKKIVHNFRKLDNYIDNKGREFVKSRKWLPKLERKLDVVVLSLYTIGTCLDYVATKMYCKDPSWEYDKLTRYLMDSYGIGIGLSLATISWYIGLLVLSYGLYKASDWYLKRGNLEFPVVRKLGPYSILSIAAIKHIYGALGWLI